MEGNRIVLMPKNPTCLFTYWDISKMTKEILVEYFETDWPLLQHRLRLHDVTCIQYDGNDSNRHWDLHIHHGEDYCFIKELQPNTEYCIEYGILNASGNFIAIMRSNTVKLPPCKEKGEVVNRSFSNNEPETKHEEWLEQFTGYSLHETKRYG